jgi:flagellar biosynthesis chaperone FliJ
MLTSKITNLENKIKALNEINGFKKSITEYRKIRQDIEQLLLDIENKEKYIEHLKSRQNTLIPMITDEEYQRYMDEITSLGETFDKLELEEQLRLYPDMITKINLCGNYLEACKMDIVFLKE